MYGGGRRPDLLPQLVIPAALKDALCGLFSLFTDNDNEVVTTCGLLSAMHPQVCTAVLVLGAGSRPDLLPQLPWRMRCVVCSLYSQTMTIK